MFRAERYVRGINSLRSGMRLLPAVCRGGAGVTAGLVTYPRSFLWDMVKLNRSLFIDDRSILLSSSIFSRESGLLFCKRGETW